MCILGHYKYYQCKNCSYLKQFVLLHLQFSWSIINKCTFYRAHLNALFPCLKMYSLKKSIKRNVNVAVLLISPGQRVNQLKVGNSNKVSELCWQDLIPYFWSGSASIRLSLTLHVTNVPTRRTCARMWGSASRASAACGGLCPSVVWSWGCFPGTLRLTPFLCEWARQRQGQFIGGLQTKRCRGPFGIMSVCSECSARGMRPRLALPLPSVSAWPVIYPARQSPGSLGQN